VTRGRCRGCRRHLEEVEESESRSRITQLWWLEHELTSVHTNLEYAPWLRCEG
jgi:hypothetical protein